MRQSDKKNHLRSSINSALGTAHISTKNQEYGDTVTDTVTKCNYHKL